MNAPAFHSLHRSAHNIYGHDTHINMKQLQLDLVYRVAIVALGFITVLYIYKRLFQGSTNQSIIKRISYRATELSRNCFKKFQDFRLVLEIKFKLPLWKGILDRYNLGPSLNSKKISPYEEAEIYKEVRNLTNDTEPAAKAFIKCLFKTF